NASCPATTPLLSDTATTSSQIFTLSLHDALPISQGDIFSPQVLVQHRHHADWKIPGDAATDLEKAQRRLGRRPGEPLGQFGHVLDRKSTRLNSSHQIISYAVFCLKKKNKTFTFAS